MSWEGRKYLPEGLATPSSPIGVGARLPTSDTSKKDISGGRSIPPSPIGVGNRQFPTSTTPSTSIIDKLSNKCDLDSFLN